MRRAFQIAVAVFALFAFTLGALAQSPAFAHAMQLFRERQWAEAATAFAECERTEPGKTDALLYRGKSLVNLGRWEDAASSLNAYRQGHPQSDDAVYLLAYVRFREDKPQESLPLFTEAAKLREPTADDLKIVALDYVLLNDYEDAAHYLEIALRMDPANVEARYHLGRVRYQQNRFDLAIEAFQEVLRADPGNVKAQDNLALSLDAENKTDQAIAAYRKAIEMDSAGAAHSEQPYLNLGILLAKSNRQEEAIPLLTRASEIAPKAAKPHYELGKAYFELKRLDPAQREAEQAVALEPRDRPSHYLLGRIYQRQGKTRLAEEQFRKTENLIHDSDAKPTSGMGPGGYF